MSGGGSISSVRLFVGVTAEPGPALDEVMNALGRLGDAVRVVRREQLHVTLKFLGDADEPLVPEIAERLSRSYAAAKAFDWRLRGIGAFPSLARPSVVWAGAEDGGRFASLAEAAERSCEPLGFPREGRVFRPHVTVARIKFRPPPALKRLIETEAVVDFGPQRAKEVVLFRSELGRVGPVHTPVHVVLLSEPSE